MDNNVDELHETSETFIAFMRAPMDIASATQDYISIVGDQLLPGAQ